MKHGFYMYKEWSGTIAKLSDEQAGRVIKNLYLYEEGKETTDEDPVSAMVFEMMKGRLDADREKEEKVSLARSEAGKLGNETRWNKGKVKKEEPKKKVVRMPFVKPTVDEVREYCIERRNSVNAESFVDFYESKGWRVGNSPMKDWKAAVRTWEKRDNKTARQMRTRSDIGNDYLRSVIAGGQL